MPTEIIDEFKLIVARRLQLDPGSLYGHALPLAKVVARSPVASNSIDLVEAFAGAMADLDIDDQVELPTMTLNNTIDEVIAEVNKQLATKH